MAHWHAAINAVPICLFLLLDQRPCTVKNVYTLYMHVSDYTQTVHELAFLPHNAVSKTFLHKLGAV
jgi:hypothetical protein